MPDEFDRALDEALSSYGRPPERSGLEQRVLAHATQPRRAKYFWPVVACAACLLIAAALFWPTLHNSTLPAVRHLQNGLPPQLTANDRSHQRSDWDSGKVLQTALPKPRRRHDPSPRQPQFPTPSPITSEERALLRLANSNPNELAQLKQPAQSLEVAPIVIEPLEKEEN